MVKQTISIRLESIPKRIKKKLAAGRDLNLAGVGRDLEPPVSKVLVSKVLHGTATSQRVKEALEGRLSEILTEGNKYGWWPQRSEGAGLNLAPSGMF